MGTMVYGRTVLVKRRLHTKGGWWVPVPHITLDLPADAEGVLRVRPADHRGQEGVMVTIAMARMAADRKLAEDAAEAARVIGRYLERTTSKCVLVFSNGDCISLSEDPCAEVNRLRQELAELQQTRLKEASHV